jgi:hypothetical protein
LADEDKLLPNDTSLKTGLKLSKQIRFYLILNVDQATRANIE